MAGEAVCGVLGHVWNALTPLGRPLALMGGVSLAAWNRIRATQDIDFLIELDRSSVVAVIYSLGAKGCRGSLG